MRNDIEVCNELAEWLLDTLLSVAYQYKEGEMVRIGSEPGILTRFRPDGYVDVWTSYGLRTVDPARLRPSKAHDHVYRANVTAPEKKKNQR